MRTFTSADAKNKLGELIDLARAAPVAITKYDRPVAVIMAVEESERIKGPDFSIEISKTAPRARP
ncbi:type II toxin-antitoxin system Phd/YefM family antitoxin [Falsiroseomonas selenitidurans]|uniref:Antitoxin n=1 Tax=Falsiroseomonas selenitidurans TaxID=2716335 RepID=A0ABX1E3E0_9PROT|nr:type II toxin-antitoxin system Phd/YefM family antitoxin [Falsiroseomonas selenitidurans]NKC31601.1 type II toxin-antitoxin system Phd/YefM family antitoxin [Falsiroseomonas selenitidurans]